MKNLAITLLLAAVAALAGCTDVGTPDDATPTRSTPTPGATPTGSTSAQPPTGAPASPLSVTLALTDAAAFFADGTTATLTVVSDTARTVRAGVTLPPGVESLAGATSIAGSAGPGAPLVLQVTLRASAPGPHVLRGWSEAMLSDTARLAPATELVVTQRDGAASTEARAPEPRAFDVTLAADASDATRLRATLRAPVATPARVVLASGDVALVEGEAWWNGSLAADRAEERVYRVALPADGTYLVTLTLWPDASVDSGAYTSQLYLTKDGDVVAATAREPGGGTTGGEEPGAGSTGGEQPGAGTGATPPTGSGGTQPPG